MPRCGFHLGISLGDVQYVQVVAFLHRRGSISWTLLNSATPPPGRPLRRHITRRRVGPCPVLHLDFPAPRSRPAPQQPATTRPASAGVAARPAAAGQCGGPGRDRQQLRQHRPPQIAQYLCARSSGSTGSQDTPFPRDGLCVHFVLQCLQVSEWRANDYQATQPAQPVG